MPELCSDDPGAVVKFSINKKEYNVSESDGVSSSSMLVSFIRDTAQLKGTKIMCHEGGCGACLVTVRFPDGQTKAVNSCLTPVLSCHGWNIYTVEFLGDKQTGYDEIQRKVVYHSGTQCGFCTPGMVMNMYSLMENQGQKVTMEQIEKGFDGNICRCTGYRSILDAMKSLATDATDALKYEDGSIDCIPKKPKPVTSLGNSCCGASQNCCQAPTSNISHLASENPGLHLKLSDSDDWVQPKDMGQLFAAMKEAGTAGKTYRLVAGNTGSGVYRPPKVDVTIDITALKLDEPGTIVGDFVKFGACTTLVTVINALETLGAENFAFSKRMAEHISRVASTPVRNRATIAGNLMLKQGNHDFPSDLFTLLESIGTEIEIREVGATTRGPLRTIMSDGFDMKNRIVTALYLPKRGKDDYEFRSYKISKRFQNAHAYVNAGFLFKLDKANNFTITEQPSICFGGISKEFIHATQCEEYLKGKSLTSEQTLDGALEALDDEIIPDDVPGEASKTYRKTLAKALLYKTILSIIGTEASPKMRSGATNLERVVSSGCQTYDKDSCTPPLYEPVRKIEAIHQTSGEAEYIADIPITPNELVGVFLLSEIANGTLKSIDATEALKVPGVVGFYQAKDIPGVNDYMKFGIYMDNSDDQPPTPQGYSGTGQVLAAASIRKKKPKEMYGLVRSVTGPGGSAIFKRLNRFAQHSSATAVQGSSRGVAYSASATEGENYTIMQQGAEVDTVFVQVGDKVSYYGQALGLIVATNRSAAYQSLALIRVEYEKCEKPKIGLEKLYREALREGTLEKHNADPEHKYEVPGKGGELAQTISGNFFNGGQYHYHMETQSCLCVPKEDSIDVFAGTQWMEHTQYVVASVLNIPHNQVNVNVRRLGGAFGAKLTRNSYVAAACALAASKLGQPVRVTLDMEDNMGMIGKRTEYFTDYTVGVDKDGKILTLDAKILCGTGFTPVESDNVGFCIPFVQNAYACYGWSLKPYNFTSNTASNTSTRGPGSVNGVSIIEYIMDHIAFELKKEPLEVRAANYAVVGDPLITHGNVGEDNKIPEMMSMLIKSSEYAVRKAATAQFNLENRWKKRGISALPVKFLIEYLGAKFTVFVAIYHFDGTVAVTHAGIEMGQGINTKVAQTVAFAFGIPLHYVKIKPSNNLSGANSFLSGASFTSELCCFAALKACNILKKRMAKVTDVKDDDPWIEKVRKCYKANVDLAVSSMESPIEDKLEEYPVWITCVTEVELDILTGENRIMRVDILQDVGKSLSPEVDIGQIEGGYIMGLGFFTTEQLIYDNENGKLLTTRSWNYKPPQTRCIPQDFRITILPKDPNPFGVLSSKTTGEPSLVASFGVVLAIKDAIHAARRDAGNTAWFQLDTPVTPEDIVFHAQVAGTEYTLQ